MDAVGYDPVAALDPEAWLGIDEAERTLLVESCHSRVRILVPNMRLHATIHVVVENQVAAGDELPALATIERLQSG